VPDPYHHAALKPFSGDPERAFDLAVAALTPLAFTIQGRSEVSLELAGVGMSSTRQSPLHGASRILISSARGALRLEAELDGARRMARFVVLFPVGLSVALGVILAVLFGVFLEDTRGLLPVAVAAGGNSLVWLLVGPLLGRYIRARVHEGLDALLANMVAVA
jgi:hypothetical protein